MRFAFALTLFLLIPANAFPENLIRFGVLADLTGTNAANGEDCRRGVAIAQKPYLASGRLKVGPYLVEVLMGDHAGDPKTGVNEFKKMVEAEGVYAMLATRSQIGMPLNPLSKASHTPLLGSVGHPAFVTQNPFAYRFYPTVQDEGPVLADLLLDRNLLSASALTAEDEWTLALYGAFSGRYEERGGVIKAHLTTPIDVTDLSSTVSILRNGNPQAIFINLTLAQSGLAVRKLREQGYKGQLITNFWGANPDSIIKAGPSNSEGLLFAEVDLNRPRFRNEFSSLAQERPPTSVGYVCYAAFSAMLQALEADDKIDSKEKFSSVLSSIRSVRLLDEVADLGQREVHFKVVPRTIRAGKPAPL